MRPTTTAWVPAAFSSGLGRQKHRSWTPTPTRVCIRAARYTNRWTKPTMSCSRPMERWLWPTVPLRCPSTYLRWTFEWCFVIVDVQTPIIGVDLLSHHGLLVDPRNKRLLDTTIPIVIKGICCYGQRDLYQNRIRRIGLPPTFDSFRI